MSGGHFGYAQYRIEPIAEDIENLISGEYPWSPETVSEFQKGAELLRKAFVYAQRIDWLVSCDDGEDTFHERLKSDLQELKND